MYCVNKYKILQIRRIDGWYRKKQFYKQKVKKYDAV